MTANATLARRLNTTHSTMIGLSSMVGAGVFVAFAPAAQAAGSWLLIGLAIAALVAGANAASTAQLAAAYPRAGGAYIYGREQLGPWWGFTAGWSFVVGKTASCAAIALVFASYLAPAGWEKPLAVGVVVFATVINLLGVRRTAQTASVIVVVVIAVLIAVVALGFSTARSPEPVIDLPSIDIYGVLQSASVLFFAFAGYARIATLGEEVVNPARSIPRAIAIALTVTIVLYAAIGASALWSLGADNLALASAPLTEVVGNSRFPAAAWIVATTAAVASVGALVSLLAGVGRTTFALARNSDLPRSLSTLGARFTVPYRADLSIAVAVILVVIFADVGTAIGFSSFGVLLYYFVANVASFRLPPQQRRVSRIVNVLGAAACLLLAATVPPAGVVIGVIAIALGVPVRLLSNRRSSTVFHRAA